jgi:tetratricopeptide (TPR) repeat protein
MALRLTDPNERPSSAAPAAAGGAHPRVDPPAPLTLAARAVVPLRAGEARAWGALFAEAATLPAPHERYRARRLLVERALDPRAGVPDRALAPVLLEVAARALGVLDQEPREPVLLNYAGAALYELGSVRAARRLFEAAQRLDADLPHVRSNVEQAIAREGRGGAPRLPRPLAVRLDSLARDAERVASRARPAEGLTLSLCMIVKDEQEMLPRCLAAVRDAVDEIVVVDTGSSDRTIEIAREFGARVIEREWTGSFADARNVSFEAATGDWLLYLDADEVLVAEDAPLLRELTGRTWREAFYLVETNHTGDLGDGTAVAHNALRVFRNRPEYRFEGRIHEQIAHRLPAGLPERLEPTRVRVEHFGYLGSVRDAKEKSRRNIELLERQVAEGVETPFLAFNLGSEHAAAGDARAALAQFEKAWKMLDGDSGRTQYGYVPSLCSRLVKALRVTGRHADAERRAIEGLELFPGFTDLVFEQATSARQRGERDRAAALYERCLELGDAPSRYSPTVGCGGHLALTALAELRLEMGDPAEAERLLERCLAEHPSYLGVVEPYARALLGRGIAADAARERIEAAVEEVTPSVSFMLGTALYEAGQAEAAEPCFRSVLEAQPESDPARLALAEVLLSQRRWREAAAACEAVAPQSACAAGASRSRLFALLAGGEDAGAEIARARGVLPGDEHALFRAWEAARRGSLPPRLPDGAVPLLATVLEALLRVEEFETFELLLPALDRAGIPWRERRELLASMYLRRGFLESAADEWIEVCEASDPDAAALVGLAQVALARGMQEDALTLAEEARVLAPERADAAALVAAIASPSAG